MTSAIINIHYDAKEVMSCVTEVLCYGTGGAGGEWVRKRVYLGRC